MRIHKNIQKCIDVIANKRKTWGARASKKLRHLSANKCEMTTLYWKQQHSLRREVVLIALCYSLLQVAISKYSDRDAYSCYSMIELLLIIEGIMHEKRRGNFPTYQPNLNQKRTKQPAKFKALRAVSKYHSLQHQIVAFTNMHHRFTQTHKYVLTVPYVLRPSTVIYVPRPSHFSCFQSCKIMKANYQVYSMW